MSWRMTMSSWSCVEDHPCGQRGAHGQRGACWEGWSDQGWQTLQQVTRSSCTDIRTTFQYDARRWISVVCKPTKNLGKFLGFIAIYIALQWWDTYFPVGTSTMRVTGTSLTTGTVIISSISSVITRGTCSILGTSTYSTTGTMSVTSRSSITTLFHMRKYVNTTDMKKHCSART